MSLESQIKKLTKEEAIELLLNLSTVFDFKIEVKREIENTDDGLPIKISKGPIKIYCDGACKGNPGLSGSGVLVKIGKDEMTYAGHFMKKGTNNTAELLALIEALKLSIKYIERGRRVEKLMISEPIVIFTDSKYSINAVTSWAYKWKSDGWVKKGAAIKNLELVKEAHELYEKHRKFICVSHVKGHSGNYGNDYADRLANFAVEHKIEGFYPHDIS